MTLDQFTSMKTWEMAQALDVQVVLSNNGFDIVMDDEVMLSAPTLSRVRSALVEVACDMLVTS